VRLKSPDRPCHHP